MEVDNFSYGKVSGEAYNRTELRTILLGPTGYSEPQFTGCEIKNVSYERQSFGTRREAYDRRVFLTRPDVQAAGHYDTNQ